MDINETGRRAPLLSIGMPVYNGERHIRQALDALLAQDFADFELIISDNASTDSTPEICAEYAARDGRIRFYRNPANMGMTWNFNRVFELAEGEFFMWAAHDDYRAQNYISACMPEFKLHPDSILVSSYIDYIEPETGIPVFTHLGITTPGLTIEEKIKTIACLGNQMPGIIYGIFKRKALSKVMPVGNMFAADNILLVKLVQQGEFITVPSVLMYERTGGASSDIQKNNSESGRRPCLRHNPYFSYLVNAGRLIISAENIGYISKIKLMWYLFMDYLYMEALYFANILKDALLIICPKAALWGRRQWYRWANKAGLHRKMGVEHMNKTGIQFDKGALPPENNTK